MIAGVSLLLPLLVSALLLHSVALVRYGSPSARRSVATEATSQCAAGTSETCLGCHDGSSARAVNPGSSHPWGVVYERSQIGGRRFLKPSSAPSGFGSTIANDLLCNGKVECTSCHVPHGEPTTERFRLRTRDGVFSSLCRGCHDPR